MTQRIIGWNSKDKGQIKIKIILRYREDEKQVYGRFDKSKKGTVIKCNRKSMAVE